MSAWAVLQADVLDGLRLLPDESVQCVVTSPPYWGLRDYGVDGQIGLETSLSAWLDRLVDVFHEVRRVLAVDGTLWLNMGDAYCTKQRGSDAGWDKSLLTNPGSQQKRQRAALTRPMGYGNLKQKDLIGQPWRLAFALQDDGWWLRSDIIWAKTNPMPESVKDRPTKSHEYLFLLAKSRRYYYDGDAIREPLTSTSKVVDGWAHGPGSHDVVEHAKPKLGPKGRNLETRASAGVRMGRGAGWRKRSGNKTRKFDTPSVLNDHRGRGVPWEDDGRGRNKRTVWTISTEPTSIEHFATFPKALVEPCILAGTRPGDLVVDPFCGSGTTGIVALRHGRRFVGLELNAEYAAMARRRIEDDAPLLNSLSGGEGSP